MDIASVLGIAIAGIAIFGGFMLEGGHLSSIMQPTAGIIVVGGMIGALFVQFSLSQLKAAAKGAVAVFRSPNTHYKELVDKIVEYARKARREGMVSLEQDADGLTDPFFKKALSLAVDGSESKMIRDSMEAELQIAEEEGLAGSKVFEAAGGYAPTVGILGAVLGLIHVMQNLSDPDKLGAGIAVAFVATVYGVALANLLCLPMAGKLKGRHEKAMMRYEIIMIGITAIVDGDNPKLIEQKLMGFCAHEGGEATAEGAEGRAAAEPA